MTYTLLFRGERIALSRRQARRMIWKAVQAGYEIIHLRGKRLYLLGNGGTVCISR